MANQSRGARLHVDADGVRTIDTGGIRPRVWLLLLGMILAGVAFIGGVRLVRGDRAKPAAPVPSHDVARRPPPRNDPRRMPEEPARHASVIRPRPRAQDRLAVNAPAAEANTAGGKDAADEVSEDEPTGIALFPPPGTDPIKPGIVVPDDFELPAGYVRHYQVTDDGKPLAAILMFHPDYEFVDERGAPVSIPADHVVPPEMAPAGLPIEMLQVPETDIPMIEPDEGATEAQP